MGKKSKAGKGKAKGLEQGRASATAAAASSAGEGAADGGGKRAKGGSSSNLGTADADAAEEDLVFEDPFEDEFEEEEQLFDDDTELPDDEQDGEGDDAEAQGMDVDTELAEPQSEVRTFRPGLDEVPEGEEMEYDPSAYHMYHSLRPEWPCLSFDFIRDKLGTNRVRYPHTVFAVAGTQAARGQPNKIQVMKLADLHKTQKLSADDEEDQESDEEDDNDVEPMLDHIDIAHNGGINRIRSMPQQPGVVASWSEKGSVYLTDVTRQVNALDKGGPRDTVATSLYTFKGHPDEGFAMDWSRVAEGRLLTGCCGGHIHVHEPQDGGAWATDQQASLGHTASVEELQWSPTEHTVFASASADGSMAIWDTRRRAKPMLSVDQAHGSQDVNVMSWNTSITYLLASGGDDGVFRVWDLRSFGKATPEPVAQFSWHKAPITSIEWDPNDESMLAVAGADNQVTVWDLSVEADDGDLVGGPNRDLGGIAELKLPPQLLFVHQGQHDIKELHFHTQHTYLKPLGCPRLKRPLNEGSANALDGEESALDLGAQCCCYWFLVLS